MKPLTEDQMEKIADDGSASTLNPTHKKQFMIFMFGEEFMESEDKGSKKVYEVEA
tara:strand:+ start:507 stop:671 length:165 start_codon:yes stop_codon:yes gene_type:complete